MTAATLWDDRCAVSAVTVLLLAEVASSVRTSCQRHRVTTVRGRRIDAELELIHGLRRLTSCNRC
jgi:hypothetical protein